jgi:hypothetical protein
MFNRELTITKDNNIIIHININNPYFYKELLDLIKRYEKEKFKDLTPEEIKILYPDTLYDFSFDDLN